MDSSQGGDPQGASLSPLLANLYLHYVFDLWDQRWRTRRARGDRIIVRIADDFILEREDEVGRRWRQSTMEQDHWLGAVIRGYCTYHAVRTNVEALSTLQLRVTLHWHRSVRRRNQRDRHELGSHATSGAGLVAGPQDSASGARTAVRCANPRRSPVR